MLQRSLEVNLNRNQVFKSGQGAGKSGSFFFYSFDNKFLIKTISQSEKDLFLAMLGDYIDHISTNPRSILARIYGMYTIRTS